MSTITVQPEAQVHLLAIRKALANRSAAVMVGAGFSRNAEGGEHLATWRQLTEALADELEPERKSGGFSPGAAAQLAEQYAKVFSPVRLEQLIKRCVPDEQVSPGRLHTQLLELQWSEVFTTNYDTLLERAAERMYEAAYFTVCSREDIPQSKTLGRRRIVKLHGSFPSHRPFILTEEEYRTYPERFAPFVNMVRQSLLENVFCLIGFSGDDPNFLHWLGWVRDMLDKHALPVYLFLASEPTLGERKLYEARGVVPVLLPRVDGEDPGDYGARYRALLTMLATPLEDSPLDWGDSPYRSPISRGEDEEDLAECMRFLEEASQIAELRRTYPGWLVAPRKVRLKFRKAAAWLEQCLLEEWLVRSVERYHPHLLLWLVDLYCWTQRIVLSPLIDTIAAHAARSVLDRDALVPSEIDVQVARAIRSFESSAEGSLAEARARVSMVLLTWARQSHRSIHYFEFKAVLEAARHDHAAVSDHLTYEEALVFLQRADRPSALALTRRWRPAPANGYAHVLRAALLAELGDEGAAIATVSYAIQTLRRQQRSRPNDPQLISQEAWACLIARQLHEAGEFFARFGDGESQSKNDGRAGDVNLIETFNSDDLEERLGALMARGYSAEDELNGFASKLRAETSVSAPNQQTLVGFNIGTSALQHNLGNSREVRDKIDASFAWLELVERVGLPLSMKSAFFYSDEVLQAAWWARLADTPERSLGLLLRTHQKSALKPYDAFRLPHRTGWLDRREIATIGEAVAVDLTAALVGQLIVDLRAEGIGATSSDRCEFLADAIGRLALRVRDTGLVGAWLGDLISLHDLASFQVRSTLWAPISAAISRLIEALPNDMQESALVSVFQIPLLPASWNESRHRHQIEHWVDLRVIADPVNTPRTAWNGELWAPIVKDLVDRLSEEGSRLQDERVWSRLSVLAHLKILTDDQRREAGAILWRSSPSGGWPCIPGHHPSATLHWTFTTRDPASRLLSGLVDREFSPFASGSVQYNISRTGRSYSLGGATAMIWQIYGAMRFAAVKVSLVFEVITRIDEWLDREQKYLLEDMSTPQIADELREVCDLIDSVLSFALDSTGRRLAKSTSDSLYKRVLAVVKKLELFPFPFIRSRARLIKIDSASVRKIAGDAEVLAQELLMDSGPKSRSVFRASYDLLALDNALMKEAGQLVFDALVASVLSSHSQSLPQILHLFASLPGRAWNCFANERTVTLLDVALSKLHESSEYGRTIGVRTVAQELIPNVRYYATELSCKMIDELGLASPAAQKWLHSAASDPLPEIFYGRYRPLKCK